MKYFDKSFSVPINNNTISSRPSCYICRFYDEVLKCHSKECIDCVHWNNFKIKDEEEKTTN